MQRKMYALWAILCLLLSSVYSQTFEGPRSEWPDVKLAPLEVLIDRAIEYSLEVQLSHNKIEQKRFELAEEKGKLLQPLSLRASFDYGNGDYLTTSGLGTNVIETFVLNNQAFLAFRVGVNFSMPLSDLWVRKSRIGLKQKVIEQYHLEQDRIYVQIREEVIQKYNKFLYAVKLVESAQEALLNSELAYTSIEKQFRAGDLTVDQFVRALQAKNADQIKLAEKQMQSKMAFQELKALVGQDVY